MKTKSKTVKTRRFSCFNGFFDGEQQAQVN